jgi:hypothetical protein
MLHDAPLPPWPGRSPGEIASHLDGECEWLVTNGVLFCRIERARDKFGSRDVHIMPNKTFIGNDRTKYADSHSLDISGYPAASVTVSIGLRACPSWVLLAWSKPFI